MKLEVAVLEKLASASDRFHRGAFALFRLPFLFSLFSGCYLRVLHNTRGLFLFWAIASTGYLHVCTLALLSRFRFAEGVRKS